MASKIFFSHQKVYFWISAFDHRAIILDKMHIVHWRNSTSALVPTQEVSHMVHIQGGALVY